MQYVVCLCQLLLTQMNEFLDLHVDVVRVNVVDLFREQNCSLLLLLLLSCALVVAHLRLSIFLNGGCGPDLHHKLLGCLLLLSHYRTVFHQLR